jgi:hypothetical protein
MEMKRAEELACAKTNEELLAMLATPADWESEMTDAARSQLQSRGIEIPATKIEESRYIATEAERVRLSKLSSKELVSMITNQKSLIPEATTSSVQDILQSRGIAEPSKWHPKLRSTGVSIGGLFSLVITIFAARSGIITGMSLHIVIIGATLICCSIGYLIGYAIERLRVVGNS